mgnify:CR=1 FL=1
MTQANIKVVCQNKKARFDYHILEVIEAGLVLLGTEVKSLRQGRANLKDSYARIRGGELFLMQAHISPYTHAYYDNHEPDRARKLLVHKREIKRLTGKTLEKGLTLVPLRIYFKDGKALRGTGWDVAVYEGTTYLFSSKANRKQFVKSTEKYLPQFGGYLAFGAEMGKKFDAEPTVWKVIDGKLYVSLDKNIQKKWEKDPSKNIQKAYASWSKIQNVTPEGV